MGLQPDLLLSLSQREMKTSGTLNSDQLVIQYLADIGLLAKPGSIRMCAGLCGKCYVDTRFQGHWVSCKISQSELRKRTSAEAAS